MQGGKLLPIQGGEATIHTGGKLLPIQEGGSYYPYILVNEIQTTFSQLGLVFFVLKSFLGIARQWSHEKFAILSLKPQNHIGILMYRTWLFWDMLFKFFLSRIFQSLRIA